MKDKTYFKTKSKTYALAIQYVTNKRFYKFNDEEDNSVIYSFELSRQEKDKFYEKVNKLDLLRFK